MEMADKLLKIPKPLIYQGESRNWNNFKRHFDIYMKASGFENNESEQKINIFLNIGGEEAMEIFENLNLTAEEKRDYDNVMEAFENYCKSKHNEIYKSFKFFTRIQQPSEFFSEFYNDLLVMASFCNFGDQKNRLIRDRIIAGIQNQNLQAEFLKSPDLTLEEVVKICFDSELEKMKKKNFKCEEVIHEGTNVDEESNNNYDDLVNLDGGVVGFNALDQIHIPNEILFNDMESGGFTEDLDFMELSSESNVIDIKPVDISSTNNIKKSPSKRKSHLTESDKLNMEIETGTDLSQKDNQSKVVKDRMKLVKRKTTGGKQSGARRKKARNIVKTEYEECDNDDLQDSYKIPVEDQDEYSELAVENSKKFFSLSSVNEFQEDSELANDDSFVIEQIEDRDEFSQMTNEDIELYTFIDQNGEIVEECPYDSRLGGDDSSFIEPEKESEDHEEYIQMSHGNPEWTSNIENQHQGIEVHKDFENSDVSSGIRNKIAEDIQIQEVVKVTHTKRKRGRPKEKSKTIGIRTVKRKNLPPLILKTISNKKTLLLGKMPFSCRKCDATFWTEAQLEKHLPIHVLKKPPPPSKPPRKIFKCEVCTKEFKKMSDLERHIRVHTGEKPSVCNICNKRFQQPYNLSKHLHTHTQEKNFECVICQKKFGRNDVLNRHVLTHSIVKPFKCSLCLRTFIRNSQLKIHLMKHHNLEEDPGNEMNDLVDSVSSDSANTHDEC